MKIGDTARRTDPFNSNVTVLDISSQEDLKNHKRMLDQGFKIEILEGNHWVEVKPEPALRIHRAPQESCISCEG